MSPRAEPDFKAVFELATRKGAERLAHADTDLQQADTLVASATKQLQPLVGPTAAQSLVLCRDVRTHLLNLQSSLRNLKDSVQRMKQSTPSMSEDAVLQELESEARP